MDNNKIPQIEIYNTWEEGDSFLASDLAYYTSEELRELVRDVELEQSKVGWRRYLLVGAGLVFIVGWHLLRT